MATLPQTRRPKRPRAEPTAILQVQLTADAVRRVKVEAARRSLAPGQVISQLVMQYLPAAPAPVTVEDE